jgi:hypothetical protein
VLNGLGGNGAKRCHCFLSESHYCGTGRKSFWCPRLKVHRRFPNGGTGL